MTWSFCRFHECLTTGKNQYNHSTPLSDITLIRIAIWLVKKILDKNSRRRILPDMGFVLEKNDTYSSILNYFQRNQMKCFVKWNLFLGHYFAIFWQTWWNENFPKNPVLSLFGDYWPLASSKTQKNMMRGFWEQLGTERQNR